MLGRKGLIYQLITEKSVTVSVEYHVLCSWPCRIYLSNAIIGGQISWLCGNGGRCEG